MAMSTNPPAFIAKPFVPAGADDSRSPCPALNALANHDYLPHDGKDLEFSEVVRVLCLIYRLSMPLAVVLALAGFLLCGTLTCKPRSSRSNARRGILSRAFHSLPIPRLRLDLHDLARHGRIEHDASLAHDNALPAAQFAPSRPDLHLVNDLIVTGMESISYTSSFPPPDTKETASLKSGVKGISAVRYYGTETAEEAASTMSLEHLALARFNRTSHLPPGESLSKFHTLVALGECALILSVLSTTNSRRSGVENLRIPRQWIGEWFGEEKLPVGWVPPQTVIGLQTVGKLRTLVSKEISRLERYS